MNYNSMMVPNVIFKTRVITKLFTLNHNSDTILI